MKGFIDFIRKGNLVQLAVAFVMGVAFAAVVTSFVNHLISPLLGLFGDVSFSDKGACLSDSCDVTIDEVTGAVTSTGVFLAWGAFLTSVITFLITAAAVYFIVVKPYTAMEERLKKDKDQDVAPTEVDLLTEIRDALQSR